MNHLGKVELEYLMLNTMFQGHLSINSGEEDFLKLFSIYGHGSNLGNVTRLFYVMFIPILP